MLRVLTRGAACCLSDAVGQKIHAVHRGFCSHAHYLLQTCCLGQVSLSFAQFHFLKPRKKPNTTTPTHILLSNKFSYSDGSKIFSCQLEFFYINCLFFDPFVPFFDDFFIFLSSDLLTLRSFDFNFAPGASTRPDRIPANRPIHRTNSTLARHLHR